MSNVYVFRIADNDYIREELKKGRLHQGWGGSYSNLLGVSEDEWIDLKIKNECTSDDALEHNKNIQYYKTKYKNLKKMLDINKDDIIVIPKAPTYSCFTICIADNGYTFEKPQGYDGNDFHHTIYVKEIKEYSYHAKTQCEIIHAKLRAYQSPLNSVWNASFISAVNDLIKGDGSIIDRSTEDTVSDIKKDIINNTAINRFRELGNKQTEKIVKLIFEKMGYEFVGSNSYDRAGGDADLIFADNSLAELIDVSANGNEISGNIFIQVKNKTGTDLDDIVGVKQLIKRTEGITNATKVLISTADSFTDECTKLANKNNIILINGHGFSNLIFKYID